MFVTSKGYKRGATLFLYCLAVARVRAILLKKQYVVLAAFCKCGFYDIKDACNLFAIKDVMAKDVEEGAAELEEIQQELKATHKWLDKKHDFSGQPKNSAYQAWGDMASLKLQALPELRAKALAAFRAEQASLARLQSMKAASVAELTLSVAAVTPAELQKPIEQPARGS